MTSIIQASNLTKVFGKSTAVDRISFDVQEGEIFGFLGPNGAGKTTTTRMLTGVIPPDAGTATILGHDIRSEPVMAKQGFGVVPETSNAYTELDGVTSANRTGDKWQITADNRDAVIRSLVTFSQQNGAAIVTLNTLTPSLDDAFLRLTQEAQQ